MKTEEASELQNWLLKDEKALASIILCVSPSQINHIKKCKTSQQACRKLKEIHGPSGPARKVFLFKQLLQMKMPDGGNVSEFLEKFCEIVEKLSEINVEMYDELIVIILLTSLPSSFESFVVAVETRDVLPTLSMLKLKLIEEGERRAAEIEHKSLADNQQAFAARNEITDHSRFKNPKKIKCFNCGRMGHYAAQCRERKDNSMGKSGENSFASFAMATFSLNKNSWCVDSGASSHMCCDRSLFMSYKEQKESIELVGYSTLISEGRGDIKICVENEVINLNNCMYIPNMQGNFISVRCAVEKGFKVIFENDKVIFQDKNGSVFLKGRKEGSLFFITANTNTNFHSSSKTDNVEKWHQ